MSQLFLVRNTKDAPDKAVVAQPLHYPSHLLWFFFQLIVPLFFFPLLTLRIFTLNSYVFITCVLSKMI